MKIILPLSTTTGLSEHYHLNQCPERQLVSDLMNETPGSFKKLYKMYGSNLFGVIFKIVNRTEVAEDLLQEVFIKISANLHSYNPGKSRLFTWMLNISRHTAIDYLRKTSTKNAQQTDELENVLPQLNETHFYSMVTDTMGIKKFTQLLPEKQRQMIDLVYFQGYTHTEIAQETGIPLGSVKTLLRTGIIALRKIFLQSERLQQSA